MSDPHLPDDDQQPEPCQFDLTQITDPIWLTHELRRRGYAVVTFLPHELHGVDPRPVQDQMTRAGWDAIGDAKEGEWCPKCKEKYGLD
jgi:hypothetical protein